jgi:hypothetical protein
MQKEGSISAIMIPIGYMLKKVAQQPDWLNAPDVHLIYSLSGCVSENFMDYIPLWKHNGWWLFDDPSTLRALAVENRLMLDDLTMFYFEAFESEYDAEKKSWNPIVPEAGIPTNVKIPGRKSLHGYDVASFSVRTSPECSPLSCNSLACTIPTNQYCLLDDFQAAHDLVEQGVLHDCEPGPHRVISVYTVP